MCNCKNGPKLGAMHKYMYGTFTKDNLPFPCLSHANCANALEVLKVVYVAWEVLVLIHRRACAVHIQCHWGRTAAENAYLFNLKMRL